MREVTDDSEVFILLTFSGQNFQLSLQPSTNFGSTYSLHILHSHILTQNLHYILKAMVVLRAVMRHSPYRAVNTIRLGYKNCQLMLYREIMAVCSEIHTKHVNTLCGQNVELLNVKLAVHIVTTGL